MESNKNLIVKNIFHYCYSAFFVSHHSKRDLEEVHADVNGEDLVPLDVGRHGPGVPSVNDTALEAAQRLELRPVVACRAENRLEMA